MTSTFLWAGLALVVPAAARSTWSPCGLSMLSTITPFGERSRGYRYRVTVAWFLAGAVAGGLTLGAAAAALAVLAAGAGLGHHQHVALAALAVVAAAAAAVDAEALGPVLPLIRRQVDDGWLSRYRRWAYASGFGWQIGTGFATYLMTAAVPCIVLAGVASARPGVALLLGGAFGAARGSTVLLTAGVHEPGRLRLVHRRLSALTEPVRWSVIAVLTAVSVSFVGAAGGGRRWQIADLAAVALAVAVGLWSPVRRRAAEMRRRWRRRVVVMWLRRKSRRYLARSRRRLAARIIAGR